MKQIIQTLVPQFMKHFSVGSSVGLCIGFGLSLWFHTNIVWFLFISFLILALVGLYDVKDDFIEFFK